MKCPFCSKDIQEAAIQCRFCGRTLPGPLRQGVGLRESSPRVRSSPAARVFGVFILAAGVCLAGYSFSLANTGNQGLLDSRHLTLLAGAVAALIGVILCAVNPQTRRLLDWILPHRLILAHTLGRAVEARTLELLPEPYNPAAILVEERVADTFRRTPEWRLADFSQLDPLAGVEASSFLPTILQERQSIILSGLDGAGLLNTDLFQAYFHVDSHVYEGVGQFAIHQISNLGNLAAKLSEHQPEFLSELAHSAVGKVFGHALEGGAVGHVVDVVIGEASQQIAAAAQQIPVALFEHLMQGHEGLATAAVDLYKAACQFQSIALTHSGDTVQSLASAAHFDPADGWGGLWHAYHSSQDHFDSVEDSLHHADTILSHAQDATHGLLESADLVHAHVPIFTIAFSSWREWKLLQQDKTDFVTVVTHVASDGACAGGGALAGGKAGALAGSFFGPVGTAVGMIGGGILGAMGGRTISKKFKHRTFDEVKQLYEEITVTLEVQFKEATENAAEVFEIAQEEEQARLLKAVELERERIQAATDGLCIRLSSHDTLRPQDASAMVDSARSELQERKASLTAELAAQGVWRRIFWPSVETFARREAMDILTQCEQDLAKIIQPGSASRVDQRELFDALAKCRVGRTVVTQRIRTLEELRASGEEKLQEAVGQGYSRVADMRAAAFQNLVDRQAYLTEEIREQLAPQVQKATEIGEKVRIEAGKLGYNVAAKAEG